MSLNIVQEGELHAGWILRYLLATSSINEHLWLPYQLAA
jgi:hypothetical protein